MNAMKSILRVLSASLAGLVFATVWRPVHAQTFEPTWQLALDLAFVDPSGDSLSVNVGGAGVDIEIDDKMGVGIRAEYLFSESLAVEIGVLGTSSIDVTVGDLGNAFGVATRISNFAPVTLGLNYHFATDSRVDFFAGPYLAIVNYGDIDVEAGTGGAAAEVSVDTDFGWGAIAGLEVPIGASRWSLQSNVRYIDTNMKGSSDGNAFNGDFDPFIFSIGFACRF